MGDHGSQPPSTVTAVTQALDGDSPAGSDAGELLPRGTTLGRYVVLKRLGQGGMGVVYLGFDTELERRVAIKVLSTEATEAFSSGETRARLLREAQAMAKVSHPNVVAVYDVGTFADQVFVSMQYVPGSTLRTWSTAARSAREIVAAYVQAGRGLEAAHAAGILHRDFKPDNVLVDDRGQVRVLDFGLARLETKDGKGKLDTLSRIALDDTGVHHRDALATPLTSAGAIVGTPAYMAPEQLSAEGTTARSDQFSYCVAFYEALYAAKPFGGQTIGERLTLIAAGQLEPPRHDRRVPRGVRRAILRGLRAAPGERFASMTELLAAIEQGAASPKRWLAVVSVGVVAAAAAGAFALRPTREAPCRGAREAIAPVWSDARADEVSRAFRASGSPRADEALAHARPLLDRYAESWVAMHTDACEATRVRGEQSDEGLDLRMACLAQREKELGATVDLLTHADAKMVDSAVDAVAGLAPVATCKEVAPLRAPFAPPRDEAQRRAVADERGKLADTLALENAGHWADALEKATALADEAKAAGYPPLVAEVLFCKGEAQYHTDKPEMTETHLAAALAAESAKDDHIAAQAWTALVKDNGAFKEDFASAALDARIADAAIRRAGDDEELQADLLAARGWVAYRQGDQKDARTLAEETLAIRVRVLGPSDRLTLLARSDLGDRMFDEGDIEGSAAMVEELYRERVALFGETHPSPVRSLGDLAQCAVELGDYARGAETAARVVTLATSAVRAADARLFLANALVGLGRLDEARATFDDGIHRKIATRGARSQTVGGDYAAYAQALVLREANTDAEATANTALDIVGHYDREQEKGQALGVRALCKVRRGDAPGAIADATAALAVKAKYMGVRADLIPLLARGEALAALHREREALVDLEGALAIGEAKKGDLAIRSDVRFALARALTTAGGDPARAGELTTRAAEGFDQCGLASEAKRVRDWVAGSR